MNGELLKKAANVMQRWGVQCMKLGSGHGKKVLEEMDNVMCIATLHIECASLVSIMVLQSASRQVPPGQVPPGKVPGGQVPPG